MKRNFHIKGYDTVQGNSADALGSDARFAFAATPQNPSGTDTTYTVAYETLYLLKDHLGSIRTITDSQGNALERNDYYPYGPQTDLGRNYATLSDKYRVRMPASFEDFSQNGNAYPAVSSPSGKILPYRLLYNGKELQMIAQTSLIDYGARQYDPTSARWNGMDPMAEKYYYDSPLIYCSNNPLSIIDKDGNEGVVVSGGEYDKNRYKYNFIEPAIKKIRELKSEGKDEPITWLVIAAGYSEKDIESFKSLSNSLGVNFQVINSAKEFTNYLNSKSIDNNSLSKERTEDQITSLSIFGHGLTGSVEFAYNQVNLQENYSWKIPDVNNLKTEAFNNATINLYSCNSATDAPSGHSLAYYLSKQTHSTVIGFVKKSTYIHMNKGEGLVAKLNRIRYGYNRDGSVYYPVAGKGAFPKKFIFKNKR